MNPSNLFNFTIPQLIQMGAVLAFLWKTWRVIRRLEVLLDQHTEMWNAHTRYKQWQEHEAWQENDWRNRGSRWNSS